MPVACKDRRAAVCPACAARYRADAWHLVAAGLRGGKGVPETVAGHPAVFATLTAPSFGPVHARRADRPCRPRRAGPVCPHGVALACDSIHGADDPVVGEPLCADCFDYQGAVVWNAHVGRLWHRTATLIRRTLAREGGFSERVAARYVRVSYVKVAEFQRRGLVHLHVVLRADGPEGPGSEPPGWVDTGLLEVVVRSAVAVASVAPVGGGPRSSWGSELVVAPLGVPGTGPREEPGALAGYLAKYTVKGSETTGALAFRLRSFDSGLLASLRPHVARLVSTAWELGTEPALASLRLRANAHTFGFPGHFATKSARWSTTFGALRAARAEHRRGGSTEVEGAWRFAGRGYDDPGAGALAEALAEAERAVRRRPRGVPRAAPGGSPDLPHPVELE